MTEYAYDERKFTEMLLYFAERLGSERFAGATKLNKLCYFADFAFMRAHGRPITGAGYQKLQEGPAPRRLRPVRDRLVESGAAELVKQEVLGYTQHRLVPHRPPDLNVFDDDERRMLEEVANTYASETGRTLSAESHDEMGWVLAEIGEDIPYATAFLAPASAAPEVTQAQRDHVRMWAKRLGDRLARQ